MIDDETVDESYRLIETTAIPGVRTVRLYEETWEHIAEQHPEFQNRIPALKHAVLDTISNPTLVCASRTQPATSVVFASSNNLKGGTHMLSVPVRIVAGTVSGRVTTAMFASPPKGEVLFEKGGDDD